MKKKSFEIHMMLFFSSYQVYQLFPWLWLMHSNEFANFKSFVIFFSESYGSRKRESFSKDFLFRAKFNSEFLHRGKWRKTQKNFKQRKSLWLYFSLLEKYDFVKWKKIIQFNSAQQETWTFWMNRNFELIERQRWLVWKQFKEILTFPCWKWFFLSVILPEHL